MGRIFSEAEAEIEKCAHGPKIMADEPAPTGTVNAYERIMLEAGFPGGVFQNLILKRDDIVNVTSTVLWSRDQAPTCDSLSINLGNEKAKE